MSNSETTQSSPNASSLSFTALSFAFAAACGFGLLVILHCLLIVRLTYGSGDTGSGDWKMWGLWALVPTLVLVWGLVNLRWSTQALRATNLTDSYRHLGIVLCCGLGGIGLQALLAARTISDIPIVMDYSHLGANKSPNLMPKPAATVAGDAAEGQKIFSVSCITCHGPTGDGLNNLAPSLRLSEFVQTSELSSILRVIKQGRAVTDPANKSGKAMPARGGNPFLTDQQAAHLAAFVKSLPDSAAAPVGSAGAESEIPVMQLARWVVPAATAPPVGMVRLWPEKQLIGDEAFSLRRNERRSELVRKLGLAALATHGTFLAGLFVVTGQILFGWLLGTPSRHASRRFVIVGWAWLVATVVWIVVWIAFGVS
jgi:mono/diheme cytochrome c family protein